MIQAITDGFAPLLSLGYDKCKFWQYLVLHVCCGIRVHAYAYVCLYSFTHIGACFFPKRICAPNACMNAWCIHAHIQTQTTYQHATVLFAACFLTLNSHVMNVNIRMCHASVCRSTWIILCVVRAVIVYSHACVFSYAPACLACHRHGAALAAYMRAGAHPGTYS